jgi:hypothetical protein
MRSNVNIEQHENLSTWCSCDFSGEDTFQEVKRKLSTFVSNIAEYLSFLYEIPFILEPIAVAEVNETRYVCVSLIMSLPAFKNYCAQHNLMPVQEEMQNAYEDMEASLEEIDPELQREQSKEQEEAEAAWKETFYSVYYEKFNKMKNSTLISKDKYDRIVKVREVMQKRSK